MSNQKLNVHEENDRLAAQVIGAAKAKNLGTTRFVSSEAAFVGRHRYCIFRRPEKGRPYASIDRRVVAYYGAPYQRYWEPSIKGEAKALGRLLKAVTNYDEESNG